MPVVRLYYEDMERLIGASRDTIMSRLAMMGADIGKRAEEEHVDVEFFPDRPDLYSAEGVARAMQGFLGPQDGAGGVSHRERADRPAGRGVGKIGAPHHRLRRSAGPVVHQRGH